MPTYEYECKGCRNRFELRRGFHDQSQATCPKCESEAHRLFSAVPVIFKGSGFYVTDSRGPDPSESGGGEKVGSAAKDDTASTALDN